MKTRRHTVLAGLFVGLAALSLLILREVIATVFFAITVAYVLYPLQRWLHRRGLGARVAASVCTIVAFVSAMAVFAPLAAALYLRRNDFFDFLEALPPELTVNFGEFAYTIDVAGLRSTASDVVTDVAVDLAQATPELALQLFLFALLIYGLLLRPQRLQGAVLRPFPAAYHDVVLSLHRRTRSTLYALYILQAATAFGTFVVAWILFTILGYDAAFVLGILSGLLQFVPVVGPSLIVLGLAAVAVFEGQLVTALVVTVTGLFFVGFLPDAVIRPRLAAETMGMPASLYFIGFVGGVLSVGVVGIIAGPLVIALLAETTTLLSPDDEAVQQRLE